MTEHEEFQLLWDSLVPSMGKAATAQGKSLELQVEYNMSF